MDAGLCLPEEHERKHSDCDRSILEVIVRDFQFDSDLMDLTGPFWIYWKTVNGEDLNTVIDIDFGNRKLPMHSTEAKIRAMLHKGMKINLAVDSGQIVGFVLYKLAYECILFVEGLWIDPKYRGHKLGPAMINSICTDIRKIYFETVNKLKPELLFAGISGHAFSKVKEGDRKTVWEMEWKHG